MSENVSRRVGLPLIASVCLVCGSPAYSYTFQTLNNPGDANFNVLSDINNTGTIVGFYGDGFVVPNNGYTLVPPSAYTPENVPGAAQTVVAGINNSGTTVGFWLDASGNEFGFTKQGDAITSVSNPLTPTTGLAFNQLISVNDRNVAAGFYLDTIGAAHAYTYNIGEGTFTPVILPASFGAVGVIATGINNSNDISGAYFNAAGDAFGFLKMGGTFTSLSDPDGTNTIAFELNNVGDVVGSFVDRSGETQGFLYNWVTNAWQTISDPLASATPIFCGSGIPVGCVDGTTVLGIDDERDLVGFFSDGVHVSGFLATVPEPSTWMMMLLSFAGLGYAAFRRSAKDRRIALT